MVYTKFIGLQLITT